MNAFRKTNAFMT